MAAFNDFHGSLFKRIQNDDRLALNTLFTEYYEKLCGFAFTFLRSEQEAEECVADVFVSIWKARRTIVIEKSVKAYLYTCVKNAVVATIRKRHPLLDSMDSLGYNSQEDLNSPEQQMVLEELKQEIEKAVDSLPPRCKQVFLMSRMESFSYKTIAEILNISEKTVENHLIKALTNLRAALHSHQNVELVKRS